MVKPMSEDCHDSNNAMPVDIEIACHFCGEAVTPDEAYIAEFENHDGSSSPLVFHKGADRLCCLKWAAELLEDWNGRMEAMLALFEYINDGRERK
jgi:hypothetical protein